MTNGIVFQVDTTRVLDILAKEIYDSPLAMLRENLQNAYDAIRERFAADGTLESGGRIDVGIDGRDITISDNGVGMTEEVLRNNFWNAGSSGKHSERARKAGVVGTFGIGAMANFGVCTKLVVETRAIGQQRVLRSVAERSALKIGEECIAFETIESSRDVGTTICASLDDSNPINASQAEAYLTPYVSMLPVPVHLNGALISGRKIEASLQLQGRSFVKIGTKTLADEFSNATFEVNVDANAQVLVHVSDIHIGGIKVDGSMALLQSGGQLMGLRSFFGLAPVPAIGNYQFGGFANLAFLNPTAGREALSRESIDQITRLIALAERAVSELIATTSFADRNNAFLSWLSAHSQYELAGTVSILVHPGSQNVALAKLKDLIGTKTVHYYSGNDQQIISTFANEGSYLLQISPNNPRRKVQQHYVTNILGIAQVPDSAQVTRIYKAPELEFSEASVLFKIATILRDDYLVPDVEVLFADISHSVTVLSEKSGERLKLYIARSSAALPPLLEFYDKAYSLFSEFMKDFVRVNVYPGIQQYVPSSTKGGVDALRTLLLKSRELYRYEEADRGDLEGIFDFLSGESSFTNVLNAARSKPRPQTQRVSAEQVGTIEVELPGLAESPVKNLNETGREFEASPPIIRDSVSSEMKILTTDQRYPLLNNFMVFLGVSDRLMKTEGIFFNRPHTTRIIWGGHRVVYIFTEETEKLSLYYDIELRDPIQQAKTGGGMFPTTTLITKHRIFIPIPDLLKEEFQVAAGPKEFFVRFDVLSSDLL
jgi:molecular chaperone HtpG